MQATLNLGAPASAAAGAAATSFSPASSRPGRSMEPSSASFQNELHAAVHGQTRLSSQSRSSAAQPSGQDGSGDRALPDADTASDVAGNEVATLPVADIASFLLRLLQTVASVQASSNPWADLPEGLSGSAVCEAGASPIPARVLELLKQLETSPAGVGAKVGLEEGWLAEVLEKAEDLLDLSLTKTLGGKTHELLSELPEHVSGVDWKQMVRESIGSRLLSAVKSGETGVSLEQAEPAETALSKDALNRPDATRFRLQGAVKSGETGVLPEQAEPAGMALNKDTLNRPDATRFGILRAAATSTPVARDQNVSAALSGPVRWEGASTKSFAPATAASEPSVSLHSATGLAAAGNNGEGRQGGKITPPPHLEAAVPDASRTRVGLRADQNTDGAGSFQRAMDHSLRKEPAGGETAADRSLSADEALETTFSDQRLPHASQTGAEKSAAAPVAIREKEPVEGSLRTGLFDQIVKRAVVQFKNDQSEIKIDLKPEFLGNVRMQILAENQQVSVRILTELPAVRDMLEAGLQQLKSELQNQGLHVDRLEVSVSDDPHQQSQRRTRPEEARKATGIAGVSSDGRPIEEDRLEIIHSRPWSAGYGTIDMFA